MRKKMIYLDYAAATPVSDGVLQAMQPYLQQNFYNPSALYLKAKHVRDDMKEARASIAKLLGARPSEVVFTAGGTEANNLAVRGVMQKHPDKNMLISAVEHDSLRRVACDYKTQEIAVDNNGRINLDLLQSKIDQNTVLISVMYANNEIGVVQSLKEIATIIADVRRERQKTGNNTPLYFHTDAAQAPNYLDIHVAKLGVDLMTLNSGKLYGPKQVGCLYVRAGIVLEPLIKGGGQEFGLRSGTENVSGAIGFAAALQETQQLKKAEYKRMSELQKYFISELTKQVPNCEVNGSLKHRLPNNVHITISGFDNERLLMELDEEGIVCATGSACSVSKDETSHVLHALGLSDQRARASLRFSMGRGTTKTEVKYTVDALAKLINKTVA